MTTIIFVLLISCQIACFFTLCSLILSCNGIHCYTIPGSKSNFISLYNLFQQYKTNIFSVRLRNGRKNCYQCTTKEPALKYFNINYIKYHTLSCLVRILAFLYYFTPSISFFLCCLDKIISYCRQHFQYTLQSMLLFMSKYLQYGHAFQVTDQIVT